MAPILRYLIIPFVILGVACFLFWGTAHRYPVYVVGATAFVVLASVIRTQRHKKRDAHKGWRVGQVGRDSMYYEEFMEGAWHRIDIDGEMLVGKTHHVIYFGSLKFPEWANGRREEIIERIKSEFHPPGYEYVDS